MLRLWEEYDIESDDVLFLDSRYMLVQRKSWYNDMAIRAIEEIDTNRYIGDGTSESYIYGICSPGLLSGGTKMIIFAMNNPDVVCDLSWLGDNCAEVLAAASETYDMTFAFNDCFFQFAPNQKILCLEKNITVVGPVAYWNYLRELHGYT